MSKRFVRFVGALSLGLIASCASAAIIPVPFNITQEGPDYRWSYTASIGDNLRVQNGDFFTIYDFGSLAGGVQMPTNWTFASADLGANPIFVAAADDPAIPNLTFRYTGLTPLVGPEDLGTFSVLSLSNLTTTADFAAQATHDGGTQDGKFVSNHGTITVPLGLPDVETGIPEPGSAALLIIGGTILIQRRRSAREA